MLFYIRSEDGGVFVEAEQRLRQNERILRYLTVRTDAGRLRHRTASEEAETPTHAENRAKSSVAGKQKGENS
jgi:ribosomal protein S6